MARHGTQLHAFVQKLKIPETGEQFSDRRLPFQARQRGAEADVCAGAKRQMWAEGPRDVKAVRICKHFRVVVRGQQRSCEDVAFAERTIGDISVTRDNSVSGRDRWVHAERFLDYCGDQTVVSQ
jgi:hypothetical protein